MSREQAIIKLARQTLTTPERWKINEALRGVKGFDNISSVLSELGFGIGPQISKKFKDVFYLHRGSELIGNAVIRGDYQGMQVIQQGQIKPRKIPTDAYTSPGAIYERWEKAQEDKGV